MKQMMKVALVMVFALGLASCDMFNVDVDTTLSGYLDIEVEEGVVKSALTAYPFADSTTLDPNTKEVEPYADHIVGVEVGDIIAEVDSVSKADVVILAGSVFAMYNSTDTVDFPIETDWPINVGTILTLTDQGKYDDVAGILEEMEVFTLRMVGTCSDTSVFIRIRVDIETTITGSLF